MLTEDGRVALYAAPETHDPLWAFGSRTIGYDAVTGATFSAPPPLGLTQELWDGLTAEPRRYGFHATLKAPFRLSDSHRLATLRPALRSYCETNRALAPFRLEVSAIGEFLALTPSPAPPELSPFAASVVTSFDGFRAPLSPAERERRLAARLSERQTQHLERFGYPYVLEDFRFHMSLTGKVPDASLREELRGALSEALRREAGNVTFGLDALVLFVQEGPGASFRIEHREALTGVPE
jgi:hypothetical protein